MGRVSRLSAAYAVALLISIVQVSTALTDDLWTLCGSAKTPIQKLEYCTKLIRTAKNSKFAERGFLGRGNANVELGNFDDAVDDFTHAIAINPHIAGYFDNRLNALRAIGRYKEALADANAATRLAPDYSFVYRSRALVYSDLGRFAAAIADFDRALAMAPNDSGLLVDRGRMKIKAGRPADAIGDFTRAISTDPYQMDAVRERGLTYLSLGEIDLARNDLSIVIAARPNDIEVARALDELQQSTRSAVGPMGRNSEPEAHARPSQSEERATSGTGFFVGPEGYLITNAHVVEGCKAPKITSGSASPVSARVLARDSSNDLALMKGDLKPIAFASLRAGVKIGEAIATFGYPLIGLLSTRGNFTTGNISAVTGLGDDFEVPANHCASATRKQRRPHDRPSRQCCGRGCRQARRHKARRRNRGCAPERQLCDQSIGADEFSRRQRYQLLDGKLGTTHALSRSCRKSASDFCFGRM